MVENSPVLRTLILINPATGMVEMFRAAFVGLQPYSMTAFMWTGIWIVALAVFAAELYRRYDRVFVDLL
jgi:ABC-type polysaccharide/polyol phosphate export permease